MLADRRAQFEMTAVQLEEASGVPRKTIYNVENGRTTPHQQTLDKLRAALGLSSDYDIARRQVATGLSTEDLDALGADENDELVDTLRQSILLRAQYAVERDPVAAIELVYELVKAMDEQALKKVVGLGIASPTASTELDALVSEAKEHVRRPRPPKVTSAPTATLSSPSGLSERVDRTSGRPRS